MQTFWRVMMVLGVLFSAYWVVDMVVDGWSVAGVAGAVVGVSWVAQGLLQPWEHQRREQRERDAGAAASAEP